MKKYFYPFLLALALSFSACGTQKKITPKHLNLQLDFPSEKVLVKRLAPDGSLTTVDTLNIKDGKAAYTFFPAQPQLYFLSVGKGNYPFIPSGSDLSAYIDKEGKYTIGGDPLNDEINTYVKNMDSLINRRREMFAALQKATGSGGKEQAKKDFFAADEAVKQYHLQFAKDHPDMAGAIALTDAIFQRNPDFKQIMRIWNQYPETVKRSDFGKFITAKINNASVGALGTRAVNFSAPNPEGKTISLFSAMGKVTIIDFWASWCRPCRANNPHLVELYNKYHDSGLNIISVSLDKNKNAWVNAIKQDGLIWYNISHLKGWREPIAKQYGITYIPQMLILDAKGIIQAKNLRGKALEEKVKELLKQ